MGSLISCFPWSAVLAAAGSAPASGAAPGVGAEVVSPVPVTLFFIFAGMTVIAALTVALARNIVRAAAGLLFALAGVSGLYFLLHAEFLAAVQLVVYVGGTLILIIFGVMLTSKSPNVKYEAKRWEILWAGAVGLVVAGAVGMLMYATWGRKEANVSGLGDATYPMQALGKALLDPNGFLAPFELVSVVLLAVMIGAAYLAKSRKKSGGEGL